MVDGAGKRGVGRGAGPGGSLGVQEAGDNTTVGEAGVSREKQARNWGDYGSKPPSRGKASDIRIVCAGPSSSRSQLTRCTPWKASLFGQMRAVTANHFPSQSSSNVDVERRQQERQAGTLVVFGANQL